MAFHLPTFNLTCNIDTMPVPDVPGIPPGPYRIQAAPCQLTYGRRTNSMSTGGTNAQGALAQGMNLLLPMLTDVRGPQDTVSPDMVEVPAGSGRWYSVYFVDDIGKGFTNEHRSAGLLAFFGSWLAPYL